MKAVAKADTPLGQRGFFHSTPLAARRAFGPNPEIVKLNGRPFSKEYEKIAYFREYTKNQEHKLAQIEIILGIILPYTRTLPNLHISLLKPF